EVVVGWRQSLSSRVGLCVGSLSGSRSRQRRRRSGLAANAPARRWSTRPRGLVLPRRDARLASSGASSPCGSPAGGDRTASATTWACHARRLGGCWPVIGCRCWPTWTRPRSEEHTSELQSRENLVCRL